MVLLLLAVGGALLPRTAFSRALEAPATGGPSSEPLQVRALGAAAGTAGLEGSLRGAVLPATTHALRGVIQALEAPRAQIRTSIISYTVQPGDTVLGIAARFGLSGNTLLWSNPALDANPDLLSVGQQLSILPVDGALYTVSRGDSLESIAKAYSVSVEAITGYEANGLTEPYALTAGQQLVIPGGVKPYVARSVSTAATSASRAAGAVSAASGAFVWPMSGYISQGYWAAHQAIDIAAPQGRPVVAVDNGYVATAGWSNVGYGNMVIVDHGNGVRTLYAHFSAIHVEAGQTVSKGQTLGLCGSTGRSTGPHLHLEVVVNGVRRNPLNYLP